MTIVEAISKIKPATQSKGFDGYEAFYMVGRPVTRVYESDLSRADRNGNRYAGQHLKALQKWRVKFLRDNER